MLRTLIASGTLALALGFAPAVVADDGDGKKSEAKDSVQKLLDGLAGDQDYDTREESTEGLIKLGRGVAARVRKLHDTTKDPEVKVRTRFILDKLGAAPKPRVDEEDGPAKPSSPSRPRRPAMPGAGQGMSELFKQMQLPKGFEKLFEGMQKQLEKEFGDMLDPRKRGGARSQPGKPRVFTWSNVPKPRQPRRIRLHDSGLSSSRPSAALRSHLGLGLKDGGIVVDTIAPGSYAEKAGLKTFDVLLKLGEAPLSSIRDLDALRAGAQKATLIRHGKRMVVDLPKLAGRHRPLKKSAPSTSPKKKPAAETRDF